MNDYDLWMNSTNRTDYVHRWYSAIADLTFPTFFIPFTTTEVNTLLRIVKQSLDPNPRKRPVAPEVASAYAAFVSRVENELARVIPAGSRFFGRLGSRSPKDATLNCASGKSRFHATVNRFFAQQKPSGPIGYSDCELSIRAEVEAMSCSTAAEMFEMFVNSERIRDDLIRELKFSDPSLVIVVRQWEERLNPLLEFRCFVCNHTLCAVTQYDARWYVEAIHMNRNRICDAIQLVVAKIHPRLAAADSAFSEGNYCVDMAVFLDPLEVKVVELNQLSITTGTGLFDWDADHAILHGQVPFEFRVVEEWPFGPQEVRCWVSGLYGDVRSAATDGK